MKSKTLYIIITICMVVIAVLITILVLKHESNSGISNTVSQSGNLDTQKQPIIINNHISLPMLTYANPSGNGSYSELIANYFRYHIYPIQNINTQSNIDTIYKFIKQNFGKTTLYKSFKSGFAFFLQKTFGSKSNYLQNESIPEAVFTFWRTCYKRWRKREC